MARQSKAQKDTVARVMHEYKHGGLPLGTRGRVRSPKQAIAIALSEAGASNRQTPAENRRRLAHTKAGERAARRGEPAADAAQTRAQLYRAAQEAGIPGRSRMSKEQLRQALHRR